MGGEGSFLPCTWARPVLVGDSSELLRLMGASLWWLSCTTWCGSFPRQAHSGTVGVLKATQKVKVYVCRTACSPCLLLQLHTSCRGRICDLDHCCWWGRDSFTFFHCFLEFQYPHLQMYGCVGLSNILLCLIGNPLLVNECPFSCNLGRRD